ncbi:short chain dehydrogenase reductase family [Phlyctema vagabunda]|uniref:Short chain dehydrogenase reductase family n=1 Tax=Phlyctema vagabunda TaxID=108571 RepID=A0ABR4PAT9_9HELO
MANNRFDKLKDQNVLVLGGSSGVGFAVAEGALTSGARVFIASSSPTKVTNAVERLQAAVPTAAGLVSGHNIDLSSPSELDARLEQLLKSLGVTLDHIVFTAGNVTELKPIQQATFDDIVARGVVRFFGPLLLAKHAKNYLRNDAASSITLTGAATSDKPLDNFAVEAGYASGLEGIARALSIDLAPIRVNVIKIGVVRTEIFDRIPPDYLGPVIEKMKASTTIKEIGEPHDVAEAYLHALRDRYFVGHSITVDGGLTLT